MKNTPKRNAIRFAFCIAMVSSSTLFGCGDRLLLDDPRDLNIQVTSPVFNVPAGVHNADLRVAITCATPGAEIHYTVDGSNPTDRAPRFSGNDPLTIAGNGTTRTIRAIAVKQRLRDSEVVTATYVVRYLSPDAPVAAPQISPATGSVRDNVNVTITQTRPGATVYYTTDGSSPLTSATRVAYTGPFTIPYHIDSATNVQTASSLAGSDDSPIASATYTFLPPKIYAGVIAGTGKLYQSENRGKAWSPIDGFPINLSWIYAIKVSGNILYCATAKGLAVSSDEGNKWGVYLAGSNCTSVDVSADQLYVGTNTGLRIGKADGSPWITYSTANTAALLSNSINDVLMLDGDLYAATSRGITIRKKSGTWSHAYLNGDPTSADYANENSVRAICRFEGFIVAATKCGIFSSLDKGETWTKNDLHGAGTTGNFPDIASYGGGVYAGGYYATNASGTPSWTTINSSSITWEPMEKMIYPNANQIAASDWGIVIANGAGTPAVKFNGLDWCNGVTTGQITAAAITP